MNYSIINSSIIKKKEINLIKNKDFYKYLQNNSVAFFYSKDISKHKNDTEKNIIKRGSILNEKYYKSLFFLCDTLDKNNIEFALYKTNKYVSEVVDGDVDFFIHKKDFSKLFKIFTQEGFNCVEDEPLKGKCIKEGFCILEPHVNISWREILVLSEEKIWQNTEEINIKGKKIKKVTKEIDVLAVLLSTFYEPDYIKLYDFINFLDMDKHKLMQLCSSTHKEKIDSIFKMLTNKNTINKKFPVFLPNNLYLNWWLKDIFLKTGFTIRFKLFHITCFFFWKYRYKFTNQLPFAHLW